MFLQEILEVAIGIIFMWLVLSIATMQILEWGRTIWKKRARDLEDAIRGMLVDPGLAERFYDHPFIRNLYTGRKGQKKPSYIPYQQFSIVLLDIITNAGTKSSFLRKELQTIKDKLKEYEIVIKPADPKKKATFLDTIKAIYQKPATRNAIKKGLQDILVKVRRIAANQSAALPLEDKYAELKGDITTFANKYAATVPGLAEELNKALDIAKTQFDGLANHPDHNNDPATYAQIRNGLLALTNLSPDLNKTINALVLGLDDLVAKGEGVISEARARAETWFNSTMDRLSGSMKRNSMIWSFIIGIIAAGVMNVDSVQIAIQLWREPAIRQVLVEKADQFQLNLPTTSETDQGEAPTPADAMEEFRAQFAGLNLPLGWTFETAEVAEEHCIWRPASAEDSFGFRFKKDVNFWFVHIKEGCYRPAGAEADTDGAEWLSLKILGILISALATVQGAPFWFDMLSKLINVRGTGAKPEEKKAETTPTR